MAALVSSTPVQRRVTGDIVTRFFTLSGNNGDTLTVPGVSQILQVDISPTTAVSVGATVAGNVITFASGGAWAGVVAVVSRVG